MNNEHLHIILSIYEINSYMIILHMQKMCMHTHSGLFSNFEDDKLVFLIKM